MKVKIIAIDLVVLSTPMRISVFGFCVMQFSDWLAKGRGGPKWHLLELGFGKKRNGP